MTVAPLDALHLPAATDQIVRLITALPGQATYADVIDLIEGQAERDLHHQELESMEALEATFIRQRSTETDREFAAGQGIPHETLLARIPTWTPR